MNWLLRVISYVLKISGLVFEVLLVYLAVSLILSLVQYAPATKNQEMFTTIYLRSNGVHLDLILPVQTTTINWSEKIPFSDTPANDTTFKFIIFGWGEENFFIQTPTWADFKVSNMLKSLFFMGESAMHITYLKKVRERPNIIPLRLTAQEYNNLVVFIQDEFAQNNDGKYQLILQNKYGKHDAFYHTKSAYNLFNTCNTWVNNALKSARQKHCLWTPFSYILFQYYE